MALKAIAKYRILPLTLLHRAEWAHLTGQHLFRRTLEKEEVGSIRSCFENDRQSGFWRDVALPQDVFEVCIALGLKHASTFGNRTLDTLHVAADESLKAEHFWTFDRRQNQLVVEAGLKTL